MKTLQIVGIETDLKTAIEKSNESYGLNAYASKVLQDKLESTKKIRKFYMVKPQYGDGLEIWYVRHMVSEKTKERYSMLQKFSWINCLHNGAAARVVVLEKHMKICIGDYVFNRDDLRRGNICWTIAS